MRDYAKQRPYSIKIRSDSAPSFPDHSNNSLLSSFLQASSYLPRPPTLLVPWRCSACVDDHGGITNPCTRNGHPSSKISANIIVKPSTRPSRRLCIASTRSSAFYKAFFVVSRPSFCLARLFFLIEVYKMKIILRDTLDYTELLPHDYSL